MCVHTYAHTHTHVHTRAATMIAHVPDSSARVLQRAHAEINGLLITAPRHGIDIARSAKAGVVVVAHVRNSRVRTLHSDARVHLQHTSCSVAHFWRVLFHMESAPQRAHTHNTLTHALRANMWREKIYRGTSLPRARDLRTRLCARRTRVRCRCRRSRNNQITRCQ